MRNEIHEPGFESRSSLPGRQRRRTTTAPRALAANAVDAAFEDETMPIVTERGSRRDPGARHAAAPKVEPSTGATLLDSLSEKLEMIDQTQRQIRRMLDEARHLRIDGAAY
jgi:hypothetical protein